MQQMLNVKCDFKVLHYRSYLFNAWILPPLKTDGSSTNFPLFLSVSHLQTCRTRTLAAVLSKFYFQPCTRAFSSLSLLPPSPSASAPHRMARSSDPAALLLFCCKTGRDPTICCHNFGKTVQQLKHKYNDLKVICITFLQNSVKFTIYLSYKKMN